MSTKSKLSHYLDLGDLGECHDAEISFNYYIAKVRAEDDYDELEIESVTIEINGVKLDVVDLLSPDKIEELETICWEYVEVEDGEF